MFIAAFVEALRAWSPGGHVVGSALLGGFLTTSFVLLERMGAAPELDADTRAAVAALASSMAV
ncbi:hypothetical protein AB0M20_12020 [Actinoplanes sp. NPDC051633]|uniref:hypothetical protein n=1 Tax=Actinoplanes sp. NPDC051633 TaxID=3155670 RepID=UPI00343069C8